MPSALRRTLAVAGAGVVGLATAVALASPASAHHSTVNGDAVCDTTTGEYVVTWTVTVDSPPEADKFKFTDVLAKRQVGDATPETITVPGVEVTEDYVHDSTKAVTAEHRVPGDTTWLKLQVKAKWNNNFQETNWRSDYFDLAGDCTKNEPEPEPEVSRPDATANSDCDYLVVKVANGEGATKDAVFTIESTEGFSEKVTIAPGGEPVEVKIPKDEATSVTVKEEGDSEFVKEFKWEDPKVCGEPEGFFEASCDSMTFYLENPADGVEITLTFTPSVGEAVTRTVKPGEEMEPVVFPGSDGLTVTISTKGEEDVVIDYDEVKPEDCGGAGGGELPRTGANSGLIAGAAGGVLVLGAGLFLIARRRRLRFQA